MDSLPHRSSPHQLVGLVIVTLLTHIVQIHHWYSDGYCSLTDAAQKLTLDSEVPSLPAASAALGEER